MIKNIRVLLLAGVLSVSLVGCSSNKDTEIEELNSRIEQLENNQEELRSRIEQLENNQEEANQIGSSSNNEESTNQSNNNSPNEENENLGMCHICKKELSLEKLHHIHGVGVYLCDEHLESYLSGEITID